MIANSENTTVDDRSLLLLVRHTLNTSCGEELTKKVF